MKRITRKRKPGKMLSLMDAKTVEQVCSLHRDNKDFGGYWILSDGHGVTIAKQNPGQRATEMTTIPRAKFNRMVKWYMKPQKVLRK